MAGVTLKEYYTDLPTMIRAQQRADEIVQRELGVPHRSLGLSRGHVLDAEVVGCRVRWPDDDEPMVEAPALPGPEAIRHFTIPAPEDNPVVRHSLALARTFYDLTGLKSSCGFNGPVTVAGLALGLDRFYTLAALDTGLAEELVHKVTEAVIAWKRYHDAEMGIVAAGSLGLCDDSASFLSPRLFARLSLPFMQRWYTAFPGYTARGLHICGNSNHFLHHLAGLGLDSFDLGEMVDLARARAQLPTTYLSRLADWRIVRDGDEAAISASIDRDLAVGAASGRFGIHVEGWRGVPLWKARFVRECVERYNARC